MYFKKREGKKKKEKALFLFLCWFLLLDIQPGCCLCNEQGPSHRHRQVDDFFPFDVVGIILDFEAPAPAAVPVRRELSRYIGSSPIGRSQVAQLVLRAGSYPV